jgi:hypothetical protein
VAGWRVWRCATVLSVPSNVRAHGTRRGAPSSPISTDALRVRTFLVFLEYHRRRILSSPLSDSLGIHHTHFYSPTSFPKTFVPVSRLLVSTSQPGMRILGQYSTCRPPRIRLSHVFAQARTSPVLHSMRRAQETSRSTVRGPARRIIH